MSCLLLELINSPKDLHTLSIPELETLADEIRAKIIETVESTGGHLGANLGVVELTLALHSVLDSPRDKIIWDVGHQSYAHKLITGRRDSFHTLRQWQGLSGYPRRCESEHDVFDVGHSSTSISAAAGMAVARDLMGESFHIAAVIGDGALTGGMAFEALNYVGQQRSRLLVVLNDNEMSISRNVGALSDYLSRLRLDPTLSRARDELENLIRRIPAIGGSVSRMAANLKTALKSILPGQLFEELGFAYFGPFDGHNLAALRRALRDALNRPGPVLLHVITKKGKGYEPAEKNPTRYHGVSPDFTNGVSKSRHSFSEILGLSLASLADRDARITAITAAMTEGTGLSTFAKRHPRRFFDVGIAEQHALTLAAGMATQGLRPVVAIYSTFLQRGYDQVVHDICLPNLPVILAVDRAGVVGDDGPTHHGVFDVSFLRHIPNLTILSPADGDDLSSMLEWALEQGGPVAIRYPRAETVVSGKRQQTSPLKWRKLSDGQDCAILAVGPMVERAMQAKSLLADISCAVYHVSSLKPLDDTALKEMPQYRLVVTVEDNVLAGGFGSALLEKMAGNAQRVICLGYPDRFIEHGPIPLLHESYGLSASRIAESVREQMVRAGGNGDG